MTINAPIDMELFQNTIHAWFVNATGLQTVWSQESSVAPEYPYASLNIISGPIPQSSHWEKRMTTDLSRPAGSEICEEATVPCTITISCQTFTGDPKKVPVNQRALSCMIEAQSALSLDSFRAYLYEANIAVVNVGAVQNINEIISDSFASRAAMDVVFRTTLSVVEYTGYIERVQIESVGLGVPEFEVP